MKLASVNDIYEVRKMSLFSDIDKLSLIDLYQPLVGASSIGLYFSLIEDPANKKSVTSSSHQMKLLFT